MITTRDTTICIGQGVLLKTKGNGLDSCWQPDLTLHKKNEGYFAQPIKTTTYTYNTRTVKGNLIVNGNFNDVIPFDGINAAIPVGFQSDYFYYPPYNLGPGSYTVGKSSNDWKTCCFAHCNDHSSYGNMLIIDGADVVNKRVWYTTVKIKKNTNYLFSTWLQTINNHGGNLASLQFSINGQVIGLPIAGNPSLCTWDEFNTTWNSGDKNVAVISIVNLSTAPNGNDFALDDIFFGEVLLKTDSIKVIVKEPISIIKDTTICYGTFFTLPSGEMVKKSDTYITKFNTSSGCDSIITTNLTVLDAIKASENVSICAGTSYKLPSGNVENKAGVYTSTLKASSGCDSIITTNLTVLDAIKASENVSICAGTSYKLPSGNVENKAGVYTSIIKASSGCDSIITTNLTVLDAIKASENVSICAGTSYKLPSGNVENKAGVYTSTLRASSGCDSIITTNLTVLDAIKASENVSICAGGSYKLPSGNVENKAGVYTSTLRASSGCDSIITTNLTVLDAIKASENVSICAGGSYKLPSGNVENKAGVYTSTLKASSGCDSIITTNLTVLDAVKASENVSICAGTSYKLPSGNVENKSGVYTSTFKASSGCDSIITTNLTVLDAVKASENVSICAGTSYKLPSGNVENKTGVYTSTLKASSGCDSIITTNLTVLDAVKASENVSICAGTSYKLPSGNVENKSGVYTSTLKASSGCDSIITTNLTVLDAVKASENVSICAGTSYKLPSGNVENKSGVYTSTIKASSGCDSIITTNLTVLDAVKASENVSICAGTSYKLPSGNVENKSGVYTSTIKASSGCDSIITTNLTVLDAVKASENVSICAGTSYKLPSGNVENKSGVYTSTIKASSGCDSIITTNLTVLDAVKASENVSICAGTSYKLPSGNVENKSGVYTSTLKASSGCDSIVTTNLTVLDAVKASENVSICAGTSYKLPSGNVENKTGVYNSTLKASSGCDSIITTNLTVLDAKKETIAASICSGQSYTLPSGKTVNTSGTYTETIKSVAGCDSVLTINLSVGSAVTVSKVASVCAGESYTLPSGKVVNISGSYVDSVKTMSGCDSIITTNLTVLDAKKETIAASICSGQSYTLPSGKTVNTSGTYTETIKTVAGCDSVLTINLSIGSAVTVSKAASVCAGESYTLPSGKVVNISGSYVDSVKTMSGCDSIITTNLTVLDAKKETIAASICSGQSYTLPSGKTVNTSGTYTETIKTVAGCDSVLTINLSVGSAVTVSKAASVCAGESYTLPSGKVVNISGSYVDSVKTMSGCDSIITTNLTVLDAKKETIAASICSGQSYTLPSGKTVNTSGTYTETIKTVAGCDSVLTINLSVGSAVTVSKVASVCAGESYTLPSGKVVNISGSYVDSVKTMSGCDSIITTNLTVLDAKKETIAASICSGQSYTLPSGKTVNTSGTYTETIKSVAGCDSVLTINLSVGSAVTVSKVASVCAGESYTLPSGKVVNISGSYVDSVKTMSGCDSIITTNLTVLDAKKETIAASICSGQSYTLPSGKTVNTSGTYTETIKTVAGCDSVLTINLSVGSAVTVSKVASVCAGESYTLPSGKVVNISGSYVDSVKTMSGCDSIITTNLTVLDAKKETIAASICSGQSYTLPSGKTVNTSGTYTETIKSVAGCDSVLTINLSVGSAVTVSKVASVCAGESYTLPSGKVVNTSGSYVDSVKTMSGCDSIITTNLTVLDAKKETIAASICSGQSYTLPSGKTVNTSGTYTETIKSVAGCDSVLTINLSVGSAVTVSKVASVCAGESYTLPSGKVVNISGSYVDSVKTMSGCDSIITTNLTVLDAKKETIAASICSGQSYTLPSGKTVNTSGTYTETIKSVAGCDSVLTINLSVGSAVTVSKVASVCAGESYTLPSGKVVNISGSYVDSVKTMSGCDSIITTNLTVLDAKKETIAASICSGQSYTLPSGKTVNTSGTYTETIKTVAGCDSVLTINLSVGSAVTVSKVASVCAGKSYTLPSGKIVNNSGTYIDSIKTMSGCDSIVKVSLTVLEAKKETLNISLCTGQTYTLPSGKIVNTSGTYVETIKSSGGCDSTVTVNLKMGASILVQRVATICFGQSYTLSSGRIVWAQGMYSETYKSVSGCDSIITTSLKIVEPQKQTISTTICDGRSYTLPSGAKVSKAGTYTDVLKSVTGCDSLISTVNLTITGVSRLNAKAAICEGEKYVLPWGKIVSKSGIYTDTVRNVSGCDSILNSITLAITAKPKLVLSKSNDINCILGVATLSASGASRYIWSPTSTLSNGGGSTQVVAPSVTTRYSVKAFSKDGCVSQDSIDVIVTKGDADGGYLLPSAFTPNGDGKNDCFGVKSWGMVADLDFSVFNRWGVLLFHTKDATQCWDGTYKGVPQNSGTYVYQVFGTTSCGPVFRKNTIVLIR